MDRIVFALPKGKLFGRAIELLKQVGFNCEQISDDSRKLIFDDEENNASFMIAKPTDIPTYVEYGAADIGIVGKDVIMEAEKDVYELLDLKYGTCHLMVAIPQEKSFAELSRGLSPVRIGTKYPKVAEKYFTEKGIQVEAIKLNGSIELGPLVGLSEIIVDIVSTGRTLRENNLQEVEMIAPVTARLIANRVSYKVKFDRMNTLLEQMRELI